ncbi:MAG: tetratricopeptide repeat protein [Pseudodesulfovibrio sp.]|nr:tetratricopeptide repeat protein [Pseudodesulfovibrio sp.]MBU4244482.1 tetratricopeptide repeat protein [Pseudomonadota bacterium]MBV1766105.1 tetratricopeptide repeat protein [Pseudodesulfovibrio sp.]
MDERTQAMDMQTRQKSIYAALLVLSAAGMFFLYPLVNRPLVLLHRAQTLASEGRVSESDALIVRAVKEGARSVDAVLRAAQILLETGEGRQAFSLMDQTLSETRSTRSGLAGQMAGLMDAYGYEDEALALLLRTDPEGRSRGERMYLADLFRRQERYGEALVEYDRLLAEDPTNAEAALGRIETLAWAGEVETALPLARELVRARPEDRAARLTLARILSWSGRMDEAESEYRRLLGEEQ